MKQNQKIAIPTNEGMLWPHFGKAPQVTIVIVEDGQIKESVIKQSPEHEHGAMLGQGAVQMLAELGIEVHAGAPALPVEQVLAMYLDDTIEYGDGSCHHDGCGGHHHHHE